MQDEITARLMAGESIEAVAADAERKLDAARDALRSAGYDTHETSSGTVYIANVAPDSSEYGGSTDPGSAWDDACAEALGAIEAIVEPHGCVAAWSDDDVTIEAAE